MMIGIFGSTGYLGKIICGMLSEKNISYQCLGRDYIGPFEGFTKIIDLGFPRNYLNRNVGKEYLFVLKSRLEQHSDGLYIYLGSLSSVGVINSQYGFIKHCAEQIVLDHGGVVVRAGLLFNEVQPGGRFKEMLNFLGILPFHPRFRRGTYFLKFTPESELFEVIKLILDPSFKHRAYDYCLKYEQIEFNEFLSKFKVKRFSLYIPETLISLLFRLSSIVKIKYVDNFSSLKK
jgi:hypothetical protein